MTAYRYTLTRRWDDGPTLGWVMLNPSTADDSTDDATIRKCIGFSQRAGCGGLFAVDEELPRFFALRVANLYPMRATDPRALHRATEAERLGCFVPTGDDANNAIVALTETCEHIVCAWGGHGARYPQRVANVVCLLARCTMLCLGTTSDGQPRHPLYVSYAEALRPWAPR